jgi:Uma2 family endonuclease
MSSTIDIHTPLTFKSSGPASFTPSAEAKKNSPTSLKEIDALIADNIETAEVSCPVILVEHFSRHYSFIDLDKLFSDHREVRLAITNDDKLIIKDMPTPLHELVNRFFQNEFASLNKDLSGKSYLPMISLGSTTTRYDELYNRYEADSSFRNMHAPVHVDDRGQSIPSIVVEIGFSETIESLFQTIFI